jgi:hypothetical protein
MMCGKFYGKEAMLRAIDENTITDAVIEQMSRTANPRLKEMQDASSGRVGVHPSQLVTKATEAH